MPFSPAPAKPNRKADIRFAIERANLRKKVGSMTPPGKLKNPNLPNTGQVEMRLGGRRPKPYRPLAPGNRKPVGKGTGAMYRNRIRKAIPR